MFELVRENNFVAYCLTASGIVLIIVIAIW